MKKFDFVLIAFFQNFKQKKTINIRHVGKYNITSF
jgi:hypothetical protein